MPDRERVVKAVYAALNDYNEAYPEDQRLPVSLDTELLGVLDSVGLVTLMVAVETAVDAEFGVAITLAEASPAKREQSPFRNAGTLAERVIKLLEEQEQ